MLTTSTNSAIVHRQYQQTVLSFGLTISRYWHNNMETVYYLENKYHSCIDIISHNLELIYKNMQPQQDYYYLVRRTLPWTARILINKHDNTHPSPSHWAQVPPYWMLQKTQECAIACSQSVNPANHEATFQKSAGQHFWLIKTQSTLFHRRGYVPRERRVGRTWSVLC